LMKHQLKGLFNIDENPIPKAEDKGKQSSG
jgi:hypothetical protein